MMSLRRRDRSGRLRAGLATAEMIVLLVASSVMIGAGAFLLPQMLQSTGAETEGLEEAPSDPNLALIYTGLRQILTDCDGLIGIREDPEGAFVEILVTSSDEVDRGRINAGEVLLLSYSRFLGSITLWLPEYEGDDELPEELAQPLDPERLAHSNFSAWWKRRPHNTSRIIATDMSTLRAERLPGPDGRATLRVYLKWDGRTSDDAGEAAFFEVTLRDLAPR